MLDSRAMGSCWLADRLWERLAIGETIVAAAHGRRLEAQAVERTIFAMVANRLSVKALYKLAGCGVARCLRPYRAHAEAVAGGSSCAPRRGRWRRARWPRRSRPGGLSGGVVLASARSLIFMSA